MIRQLIQSLLRLIIFVAYRSYQAEGLNALFLFLPAKSLTPTLAKYGAKIGENVEMHTPVTFHNVSSEHGRHYSNLRIGSDCYFGKEVFLDLAERITLEDQVTVSMRAMLLTHTHAGRSPLSQGTLKPFYAPVLLKKGCYIGAGAIIMPGISVGENAIIGAGAVVTHDVPAGVTAVGVPAKMIKRND